MEISPPSAFVQFLQTIIQVETETDGLKNVTPQQIKTLLGLQITDSKIESTQNFAPEVITIPQLMSFLKQYKKFEQGFLKKDQKIISKYFEFTNNLICPIETFFKRLKPTNKRLILDNQRNNLETGQYLFAVFQTIVNGYQKINLKRLECAKKLKEIVAYFRTQKVNVEGLSKQSLKEVMFESNLYGRINYSYLQNYIFGQDQELIRWEILFGTKLDKEIQKIDEVPEENVVSVQVIQKKQKQHKSTENSKINEDNKLQKQSQQKNSGADIISSRLNEESFCTPQILRLANLQASRQQNIKQQNNQISECEASKILADHLKIDKRIEDNGRLNQINDFGEWLNKTKQKYKKSKDDLQSSSKQIHQQHLKKLHHFQQTMRRNSEEYQKLKINIPTQNSVSNYQSTDPHALSNKFSAHSYNTEIHKKINHYQNFMGSVKRNATLNDSTEINQSRGCNAIDQIAATINSITLNNSIINKDTEQQDEKPQLGDKYQQFSSSCNVLKNTKSNLISMKPAILRQQIIEINQTPQSLSEYQSQNRSYSSTQRRQSGKIKKKSIGQIIKTNQDLNIRLKTSNFSNDQLNQFRPILRPIQNSKYQTQSMTKEREEIAKFNHRNRQDFSTLTSLNPYKQYTSHNYSFGKDYSLFSKSSALKLSYPLNLQHRQSDYKTEIQTNEISKSRLSSKKREEIVEKATLQARLRIQQIENRAMKRLSKTQNPAYRCNSGISATGINFSSFQLEKAQFPKYRQGIQVKNSDKTQIKNQRFSQTRNFFLNDMLNQRPALKISASSSRPKNQIII